MNRAPIISRRSFLKTSTTAGAIVALGGLHYPPRLAAAPDIQLPDWVDRPMRWAQLTLVEDDPGQFDPQVITYTIRGHDWDRMDPSLQMFERMP